MNKINKAFIVASIIIIPGIALATYFYVNGIPKQYQGDKKDISFDNSKPGLWKVKTTSAYVKSQEVIKENSYETCIDQAMIEEAKKKTLEAKLSVAGLQCEKNVERVSHDEAHFALSCKGINPANDKLVSAKVHGTIVSKEKSGNFVINYHLENSEDEPLEFQIKTESKRVGNCTPKAD